MIGSLDRKRLHVTGVPGTGDIEMDEPATPAKFVSLGAFAEIGPRELDELAQSARRAVTGRARICLHADHADPVQEMVIALRQDKPIAAHRQAGRRRKSYHLLEGKLWVVFFDDSGKRIRESILGTTEGCAPVLTFPPGTWHACAALSPVAIYLETISGPFDATATSWQSWMP